MILLYVFLLSIDSVVMSLHVSYSYLCLLFLSSLARGLSILLIFKKKLTSGVDFSLFFFLLLLQSILLYECLVILLLIVCVRII